MEVTESVKYQDNAYVMFTIRVLHVISDLRTRHARAIAQTEVFAKSTERALVMLDLKVLIVAELHNVTRVEDVACSDTALGVCV